MKRLLCPLAFSLFLAVAPRVAHTQTAPAGTVAVNLPYSVTKLLADPVRPRVYATDFINNRLLAIDSTTLKVIANIAVGLTPADMAISFDNSTLYVTNSGSAQVAISVIDLNALTARATFALPNGPLAIAAGLNGRVYVSASQPNGSNTAYQIDGATGAIQMMFDIAVSGYDGAFQISPDGRTLFVASGFVQDGALALNNLRSFDVSTATPIVRQTFNGASITGEQLVLSHNGLYLCLPGVSGNFANMGISTTVFSGSNINFLLGGFNNGTTPGPLAFSPDDSLVYQTRIGSGCFVDVFNTQTFAIVQELQLPILASNGSPTALRSIITDNTNSYLFVAETGSNGTTATGQVVVLATGRGPLTLPAAAPAITSLLTATATVGTAFSYQTTASNSPTGFNIVGLPDGLSADNTTGLISGTPSAEGIVNVTLNATNTGGTGSATLVLTIQQAALPAIDLVATVPRATAGGGGNGLFTVTRTGDVSKKLFVYYAIKGGAQNGRDYALLSGRVKIKPGKSSANIAIVPGDTLSGPSPVKVKLGLLPQAAYQIGGSTTAKVKIFADN